MEVSEALDKVKASSVFKDWKATASESFFSYAFTMIESEQQPWQIGFYNPADDKVVTFIVEDEIQMHAPDEVFKEPTAKVQPIDLEKATKPFDEVKKATEAFLAKQFPNELPNRTIAILQSLEKLGTIWNFTYITSAFNTINLKVNPETAAIGEHKIDSLLNMMEKK